MGTQKVMPIHENPKINYCLRSIITALKISNMKTQKVRSIHQVGVDAFPMVPLFLLLLLINLSTFLILPLESFSVKRQAISFPYLGQATYKLPRGREALL
jgi:hypothetical protein